MARIEKKSPPGISGEAARKLLQQAQLRCTATRIAVLQHLATATQPISHSDVADGMSQSGFDKSTLFRSLVDLADAGLLTRLDLGDQVRRYELRRGDTSKSKTDWVTEEHPHFVCVDCGRVTCLFEVSVSVPVPRSVGRVTEVLLRGHCAQCS